MPTENKNDINFQQPKAIGKVATGFRFKPDRKVYLIGGLVMLLMVLTILAAALAGRSGAGITPAVRTEPTTTPIPVEARAVSAYASDSAILKTEESLLQIEKDIQQTDFYETTLNPPAIDLKIGF